MPDWSVTNLDRTPSINTSVGKLWAPTRMGNFGEGALDPLHKMNRPARDIGTRSGFIPSPLNRPNEVGYEVSNHLSGTGQGMDTMSSIADDGVKLDGRKDATGSSGKRKEPPDKHRKKGVTVAKRASKADERKHVRKSAY